MSKNIFKGILVIILILNCSAAVAPFIPFNEIHQAKSQFQFNLILNQNRNTPIIFLQYSEDKTLNIIKPLIQNAYDREPDISFTILVDCRQFSYDLNNSLGICKHFDLYTKEVKEGKHKKKQEFDEDQTKITDMFMKFDFFAPNPTRIFEKGHKILKDHDIQNLRELGVNVDAAFLTKIIRNQIPDLITYIEDQIDLDQFLKAKSQYKLSKMPKLIYFDQNLQAPLFLKKLAVNLDGWIQIAVTDSNQIGARYKTSFEEILLFQFDFQTNKYEVKKIQFNPQQNALQFLLDTKEIKAYTQLRKPRDILIDFQHKKSILYNITNIKQIHQLLAHGRIVLLQVSSNPDDFHCQTLSHYIKKDDDLLFNYICFGQKHLQLLLTITQTDTSKHWNHHIYMIDNSLKTPKLLKKNSVDLYAQLPKSLPRQTISNEHQAQLCFSASKSSHRIPIFFYFNDKTHSKPLNIIKYFNSLPQINAFLYFCQFYLPNDQVIKKFQLVENTVFILGNQNTYGASQKISHDNLVDFSTMKMFLRQVALGKMMQAYDDKMLKNEILQIKSAEELTKECFSQKCIIALLQTNTFHQETQMKILKEMKISFSSQNYKYFWIDGLCHFQVGKQLKLNQKGEKLINKSYLFLYQQKSNSYALFKGSKLNKFWEKKSVFRWIKSLKTQGIVGRIKFGIDLEEKPCIRPQKKPQVKSQEKASKYQTKVKKQIPKIEIVQQKRRKSQQVNLDEL